jgi:hypothetical protein
MKTREDVLSTLDRLLDDLESAPDTWENLTLPRYLDAMRAWLESWGAKHDPQPSWELICELLEAAKTYE